jgi:hypothetical protein
MAKLEAVLEQRGVASTREMADAVALSQLHGGDVTTSLLQLANVDEAALSAALSECYGLPAAEVAYCPHQMKRSSRSCRGESRSATAASPSRAAPGSSCSPWHARSSRL